MFEDQDPKRKSYLTSKCVAIVLSFNFSLCFAKNFNVYGNRENRKENQRRSREGEENLKQNRR